MMAQQLVQGSIMVTPCLLQVDRPSQLCSVHAARMHAGAGSPSELQQERSVFALALQ